MYEEKLHSYGVIAKSGGAKAPLAPPIPPPMVSTGDEDDDSKGNVNLDATHIERWTSTLMSMLYVPLYVYIVHRCIDTIITGMPNHSAAMQVMSCDLLL